MFLTDGELSLLARLITLLLTLLLVNSCTSFFVCPCTTLPVDFCLGGPLLFPVTSLLTLGSWTLVKCASICLRGRGCYSSY